MLLGQVTPPPPPPPHEGGGLQGGVAQYPDSYARLFWYNGLWWGRGEQGCIRRERASEAAPEAVRQAVGGGCQSGWGRLLSATNATEAGTWRQRDSGWA